MTQFPEVTDVSRAFGGLKPEEIRAWKAEAEESKYDPKFGDMASSLFFKGGKVPRREDVSEEEYARGKRYLQTWLSSWEPRHEDKELVAGYILSRIAKLEVQS